MSEKTTRKKPVNKRNILIVSSIAAVILTVTVIVILNAPTNTEEKSLLIETNITGSEWSFGVYNNDIIGSTDSADLVYVTSTTADMFIKVVASDATFASYLGLNVTDLYLANGTGRIIVTHKAYISGVGFNGTSYAYHRDGTWFMRPYAIEPYDPQVALDFIIRYMSN